MQSSGGAGEGCRNVKYYNNVFCLWVDSNSVDARSCAYQVYDDDAAAGKGASKCANVCKAIGTVCRSNSYNSYRRNEYRRHRRRCICDYR